MKSLCETCIKLQDFDNGEDDMSNGLVKEHAFAVLGAYELITSGKAGK